MRSAGRFRDAERTEAGVMIINYEFEKIKKVLHDFSISTGVTIDLLREDFTPVVQNRITFKGYCSRIQSTETGKNACKMSDELLLKQCRSSRKTEMHICQAGLIDVVSPIIYADEIVGYIIFGQIRGDLDFSVLREYTEELGLDSTRMSQLYHNTVFCDAEKIACLCNIAAMLISYILFENMVKPSIDESLQSALNYIMTNLQNEISVLSISKATGISKSALYKKFHHALGCTVSEYINRKRVERAAALIKSTDLSMEEISQKVGFASASYFSRTFKRLKGCSPMNFKQTR